MRFLLRFLVLICLVPLPVHAQKLVRGQVTDAEQGLPLPAATVQVEETGQHTITNADGYFEVYVDPVPATLVIRYIGFRSERLAIDRETPARVDVALEPVVIELEELVVTGEDPAVGIMRKVIARKQAQRGALDSYRTEVYSRFKLYSDFRLVQVEETIADGYWREEGGLRHLVRARRRQPAATDPLRYARPLPVPDLYDDDVALLGFTFVGPTHPDALDVYEFELGDRSMLDDKVVYEIYFRPRTGSSTGLYGYLSVLDEDYVILKAGVRPAPDLVRPPPVQAWDLHIEQQFAEGPGAVWVPVDCRLTGWVMFGRLGVSYPTARYEQSARLTRYFRDAPVPDSLFQSDRRLYEYPAAFYQDYLFRNNPGRIPLTPDEVDELTGLDPRMTLGRAFRPDGLLRQYTAIPLAGDEDAEAAAEEAQDEPDEAPPVPASPIEVVAQSFARGLWLNRVDGFHLGLWPALPVAPGLTLDAGLGYAEARQAFTYGGGATYRFPLLSDAPPLRPRLAYVRLGYVRGDVPRYRSFTYSRFLNTAAMYLGYRDYFDYYLTNEVEAAAAVEVRRLRTTLEAGLVVARHDSVRTYRDKEGWLFGDPQRPNPGVPVGAARAVRVRLDVGNPPETTVRAGARGLRLEVEHSPRGFLGSDFDFTAYRAEANWQWRTFQPRRRWPNALAVRLFAGTYSGTLPPQRYGVLDAAVGPFGAFGAFRSLRGRPYEGNRYAGLFWEHDFGTLLFERLRLWPLVERRMGLTLHGAHGRTWLDEAARSTLDFTPLVPDGWHHEAGLSLTNLFNLPIRIDLTRRLDRPGWFVGFGIVRKL